MCCSRSAQHHLRLAREFAEEELEFYGSDIEDPRPVAVFRSWRSFVTDLDPISLDAFGALQMSSARSASRRSRIACAGGLRSGSGA